MMRGWCRRRFPGLLARLRRSDWSRHRGCHFVAVLIHRIRVAARALLIHTARFCRRVRRVLMAQDLLHASRDHSLMGHSWLLQASWRLVRWTSPTSPSWTTTRCLIYVLPTAASVTPAVLLLPAWQ